MHSHSRSATLLLALTFLACFAAHAAKPLHTGVVDLVPGAEDTSFYATAFDASTNTLYTAGLGPAIEVVNVATRMVTGQIDLPNFYSMRALVVDPGTHRLYAAGDYNDVAVIDTNSRKLIATIHLPDSGHMGVALDPALHRLYVTSYSSAGGLTIIDTQTNQIVETVDAGRATWGVAVNPATHAVYVGSLGQQNQAPVTPGKITVVNPTTSPATIAAEVLEDTVQGVVFNPTANKVYAYSAAISGAKLVVLDGSSNGRVGAIALPAYLSSLSVNPTAGVNRVYGAGNNGNAVVIDCTSDAVSSIPLGSNVTGLAANPATGELVTIQGALGVIFDSNHQRVGTVALTALPGSVAANPATGRIYTADQATNSLFVVDSNTGATIKTIALNGTPGDVAVNTQTNRIYVTTPQDGYITAIDGNDNHVIYRRPVTILTDRHQNSDGSISETYQSFLPTSIAIDQTRNKIYVLHQSTSNFITAIDGSEERPDHDPVDHTAIDQVGSNATAIAVNPATNLLYVASLVRVNEPTVHDAAAIVVKPPQAGSPTAVILDPGAGVSQYYRDILLNPSTGKLYASALDANGVTGVVKVIDTNAGPTQHSIVQRVTGFQGQFPGYLALNEALNRIYVAAGSNVATNVLRTINGATDSLDAAFDQTSIQAATDTSSGITFDTQKKIVYISARTSYPTNIGGVLETYFDGPDTVAPTGFVSKPLNDETSAAIVLRQGIVHASDDRSEVASVQVSLKNAQGQYWDGTHWVTGPEVFFNATAPKGASGDWGFPFPTRDQGFVKGDYTLHAHITDAEGNARDVTSQFHIITPGAFTFSSPSYTVDENAGSITITVQRTGGTDGSASVTYNATDGTARRYESQVFVSPGYRSFGDYDTPDNPLNSVNSDDPTKRVLNFAAGETSKTFTISVTPDDFIEGDQTVNLSLSAPSVGAEFGVNPTAVLTITDNEPSPRLTHVATVDLIPGPDAHAPIGLAANPATGKLYVLGEGTVVGDRSYHGVVSVVNAATGQVETGLDLLGSSSYAGAIGVDVAANRLYAVGTAPFVGANGFQAHLRIFELSTNTLIADFAVPNLFMPGGLAVNGKTHKVYMVGTQGGGVAVYNAVTNTFEDKILTNVGSLDDGITVNEVTNKIYAHYSLGGGGQFYIIDGATGGVTQAPGKYFITDMAVNSVTGTAYAVGITSTSEVSNSLFVINGQTDAVTTIALPYAAHAVGVDATNNRVFISTEEVVGSQSVNRIHVFDGASNTDTGTAYAGGANRIVAFPALNKLFVTGGFAGLQYNSVRERNSIGMIETTNGAESDIVTGARPSGVATLHNANGDKIYVADGKASIVYVIDGATHSVIKRIPTNGPVGGIAAVNGTNSVYFFTLTDREPVGESFTDQNNNFQYDAGEPYTDTNGNGFYDPYFTQSLFVKRIDSGSDTVDPSVAIRIGPPSNYSTFSGLTLLADSTLKKIYVLTNRGTTSADTLLFAIDANSASGSTFNTITQSKNLGRTDNVLAVSNNPHSGRLYLVTVNYSDGTNPVDLKVINGTTLDAITTARLSSGSSLNIAGIAVDSSSDQLYYSNSKSISAVDIKPGSPTENTIVKTIDGSQPYNFYSYGLLSLTTIGDTHHLFFADGSDGGNGGALGVVNTTTNTRTATLAEIPEKGSGIASNEFTRLVYISSSDIDNYSAGVVAVLHDEGADLPPLPAPSVPKATSPVQTPDSSTQLTFTTTVSSSVGQLSVKFQFRPASGGAWTDLGDATKSGANWTLKTTVPAGDFVFRAVASAPNSADGVSSETSVVHITAGPEPDAPVLTRFTPGKPGKPWTFFVTDNVPPGTPFRLQYSDNGSNWFDLPGTIVKGGKKGAFSLTNANIPAQAAFFRVIAGTDGAGDSQPSNSRSLFDVDAVIAAVTDTDPKVKTTAFLGNNVLNDDGTKQTQSLKVARGGTAIFAVHVDNNSRFPDPIRFHGSGGDANFRVQYFAQGGTAKTPTIGAEITDAVVAGNFAPPFPSGAGFTVYLQVRVNATAAKGAVQSFTVSATSGNDPETHDLVKASITATDPKNTVFVTNTNDTGAGSLREAITYANAHKGTTVAFDIPTSDAGFGAQNNGDRTFSIHPKTLLPPITAAGTVIDGTTQTAATGDTNPNGPEIVIEGPFQGTPANADSLLYGLSLTSTGGIVEGIELRFFMNGIGIADPKSATGKPTKGDQKNVVRGCQFAGNIDSAVRITLGAHGNIIGGTELGDRNVILSYELPLAGVLGKYGITIEGKGADDNRVYGNLIGSLEDFGIPLDRGFLRAGVRITGGAQTNSIGGSSPGMGNIISGNRGNVDGINLAKGVEIDGVGTSSNLVLGNRIGTAADGNSALENSGDGIAIHAGASGNRIGGTDRGTGNVISGNLGSGISIIDTGTDGNIVYGNFIGTNPVGNGAIGNAGHGVSILAHASGNVIGGSGKGMSNLISGNGANGVEILGAEGNSIQGNFIGTAFDGTSPMGNATRDPVYCGVYLNNGASHNAITGNRIGFNHGAGVIIQASTSEENSLRQNEIFGNQRLGINLVVGSPDTDGPTPNDAGDGDTGPNGLQNYPVLDSVDVARNAAAVNGKLNSTPNTAFVVELFASDQADSSGFGEGQRYIRSVDVKTDSNGNADFHAPLPGRASEYSGQVITATATVVLGKNKYGATSEFSNAKPVTP